MTYVVVAQVLPRKLPVEHLRVISSSSAGGFVQALPTLVGQDVGVQPVDRRAPQVESLADAQEDLLLLLESEGELTPLHGQEITAESKLGPWLLGWCAARALAECVAQEE